MQAISTQMLWAITLHTTSLNWLPGRIGHWPLDRDGQAARLAEIYALFDPDVVEIDIADLHTFIEGFRCRQA
jgi:hypothetical protein